jgi:PAS domain S-box-containing protein
MTFDSAALRLAAVVRSSDDMIMSEDVSGIIETWNPAAERTFGYLASEVIGHSALVIVPPNRYEEEQWVLSRVKEGEPVTHFETIRVAKDGTEVQVSLTVSGIVTSEGLIVGISKIAREVSREKQLEREAFRLAAIVESSEDTIVSKSLDGMILSWNTAAERMFGYTPEEAIGRSIRIVIPPDRQKEEDEVLARVRRGEGVSHLETVRQRKDGSLVEISLTVSPIRNRQGTIVGASKIARDISTQRRLMREAEEASRAKDEFLATLSHELRTPLNAMMGYARMLASGAVPEQRRKHVVQVIERNTRVLSHLVSDVLDLSSIVRGKSRLYRKETDVSAVMRDALEVVRPAAEAKGQTLTWTGSSTPAIVMGDTDRLQQVFWNLLMNAVKFTPARGRIDIRATTKGGEVEVTVTDNGIGIKPEFVPHVFQRFRQADSGPTRHQGGLGLGLALVRHFVELHGGRVSVSSAGEGKGATFFVALPLAISKTASAAV